MNNINAPPLEVDTMCGVDSLHIQMECSLCEITLFLREEKMKHKIIKKTKYTTEIEIILAGEKITVISTAQRRTTLEFGGLYYSRNSKLKLHFIRDLTRRFRIWKIMRLDFACDVKMPFSEMFVDTPKGYDKYTQLGWDAYYFNKQSKQRNLSYFVYNRSNRIQLFSFPLTRIEVRLYKGAIANRELGLCLSESVTLDKCAKLLEMNFQALKIRIGCAEVGIRMNVKTTLENMVEFLQSDRALPQEKDLFNLKRSLAIRDKLEIWMREKNIAWNHLPQACRKKKALISEEIGISHQVLKNAIEFAQNY